MVAYFLIPLLYLQKAVQFPIILIIFKKGTKKISVQTAGGNFSIQGTNNSDS